MGVGYPSLPWGSGCNVTPDTFRNLACRNRMVCDKQYRTHDWFIMWMKHWFIKIVFKLPKGRLHFTTASCSLTHTRSVPNNKESQGEFPSITVILVPSINHSLQLHHQPFSVKGWNNYSCVKYKTIFGQGRGRLQCRLPRGLILRGQSCPSPPWSRPWWVSSAYYWPRRLTCRQYATKTMTAQLQQVFSWK